MEKGRKKNTFRKFMNDLHLWLGIGSGIILFVICLTGTMYVFAREITEWIDRDKFHVKYLPDGKTLPLSQLVSALENDMKDSKVTSIQIPEGEDKAWLFTFTPRDILSRRGREEKDSKQKQQDDKQRKLEGVAENKVKMEQGSTGNLKKKSGDQNSGANADQKKKMSDRERIKTFLVNPYNGQIQGDAKTPASKFFTTIMGLHRWLLLDHSIGRPITGTATLLFILIEITGLILWLPPKIKKWNAWKAGFKIKLDAKWKRINYDLHSTLGFYTFLLLTLMAITGLCFSFEWFRNGVGYVFDAKPFAEKKGPSIRSGYPAGTPRHLNALADKANEVFPYQGSLRLNLPKDSVGVVAISKMHNGFIASAGTDRIYFDQYTGSILKTDRFADKRTGEKIVALIYPLHVGEVYGTFTKIIYFIACLIATSLPVTGIIIWINKLRNKSSKEKASSEKSASSKSKAQTTHGNQPKVKFPVPVLETRNVEVEL